MKAVILFALVIVLSACTLQVPTTVPPTPTQTSAGTPAWLTKMIAEYASKPVERPPASIYRYDYQGQLVYYVPPPCCDQYSRLFDASGQLLCAPDGGFTGRGDGKCPDFIDRRKNEFLVWQDSRQP